MVRDAQIEQIEGGGVTFMVVDESGEEVVVEMGFPETAVPATGPLVLELTGEDVPEVTAEEGTNTLLAGDIIVGFGEETYSGGMFCELVDEGDTAVDSFVAEGAAPSPTVTASPTTSPVRPVVVQTDFADDGSAAGTLLAGAGLVTAGAGAVALRSGGPPPCRRPSPLRSCRSRRPTRTRASLAATGIVALALLAWVCRDPRGRALRARDADHLGAERVGHARRPRRAPRPPHPPRATSRRPTATPCGSSSPPSAGEELVDAKLVPAGLDDAGILAPPAGVAGWYDEKGWPRPGFPGASILAGHINTRKTGPDTFAKLPEVRPGARVTVTYDSGDDVEFVVVRSKAVPKKETPRDDSIWDAGNPRPLLRLITCDPTTPVKGGHYVGNWVLWADAAPPSA